MKPIEKLATCAVVTLALAAAAATGHASSQPKTENGITYLSGGIGADEAKAMLEEAKRYPLSAVFFANKRGKPCAARCRSGRIPRSKSVFIGGGSRGGNSPETGCAPT